MSASALRRFNIISLLNLNDRTRYRHINHLVEQFAEDLMISSGSEWRHFVVVNSSHGSTNDPKSHLTVLVSTDVMRARNTGLTHHVYYWPGPQNTEGAYKGFKLHELETPDPPQLLDKLKNNTGKWNGSLFLPVAGGGSSVAYSAVMKIWYVVDQVGNVVPVDLNKEGEGWAFVRSGGGGKVTAVFVASVLTLDMV